MQKRIISIILAIILAMSILFALSDCSLTQKSGGTYTGKYMSEYQQALNNGDYDKAMEIYKKYLGFYDPNNKELVSDVNRYDDNGAELTDKDAIVANSIKDFSKKCDEMRLADEAFQYIINGDYEKGNKIFINENVFISQVPRNHLEKQIPLLLNKTSPIQVNAGGNSLYWVNADGTVGRIGGSAIVENWKNIAKIKVDYSGDVAGLKSDGTLINSLYETYTVKDVADFDINGGLLVANKTDGTVLWYAGDYNPPKQSGFEDVLKWSNVKSVKLLETQYARTQIVDPDGCYYSEYANLKLDTVSVPCLSAETNDGKTLISAYDVKIIYPTADEAAKGIVKSINNGGWDDVANYLQGNTLSTGSSGGSVARVERVPLSPTGGYSDDSNSFKVGDCLFKLGSDGKWSYSDASFS